MKRSREVRRVLEEGLPRTSERVVVYVAPGPGPSRAALIAGRRVGGAVRRNRAKRILREAWRALLPRIRNGYHIVFVARKSIDGAKAQELTIEIEGVLTAAGVIEG